MYCPNCLAMWHVTVIIKKPPTSLSDLTTYEAGALECARGNYTGGTGRGGGVRLRGAEGHGIGDSDAHVPVERRQQQMEK